MKAFTLDVIVVVVCLIIATLVVGGAALTLNAMHEYSVEQAAVAEAAEAQRKTVLNTLQGKHRAALRKVAAAMPAMVGEYESCTLFLIAKEVGVVEDSRTYREIFAGCGFDSSTYMAAGVVTPTLRRMYREARYAK